MAFVEAYEHDVFLSYAQLDDDEELGDGHGWVSHLSRRLEKALRSRGPAPAGECRRQGSWPRPARARHGGAGSAGAANTASTSAIKGCSIPASRSLRKSASTSFSHVLDPPCSGRPRFPR